MLRSQVLLHERLSELHAIAFPLVLKPVGDYKRRGGINSRSQQCRLVVLRLDEILTHTQPRRPS